MATPLVYSRAAVNFTLGNLACTARNTVRPFQARLYYVAACNHCGSGGDSVPTLKRLDLVGETLVETALVEGVESLRLEYGFDTDGNGSVDTYRTAAAATGPESLWENVMALKVHLIVRSVESVGGSTLSHAQNFDLGGAGSVTTAADGLLRKAYSSTVRLVNPSATREQQ
ncbi:Type IV fimbrial biogenesis protein PilW [Rubrivivax sp. A210]|uniref:PilW family protein n=1 Tax=Rubrivivax sp. A210 TaxID=2772301 RepID=UPI00191A3907|nr:PilW family protein [Rubrivivax sp. A210]CAD5371843.1 Type IV fimbrial biogenesis protein PilW [Rubrivivax sp. A210]